GGRRRRSARQRLRRRCVHRTGDVGRDRGDAVGGGIDGPVDTGAAGQVVGEDQTGGVACSGGVVQRHLEPDLLAGVDRGVIGGLGDDDVRAVNGRGRALAASGLV